MSRRLPTSPLVRILLLLILGGCLAPLLGTPVAAFGERAYESNQVIAGTNNLDVFSGESVAQSFVATDTYRLLNLTLRLRNTGDTTDALNVAIRSDAGGVPSNTDLATAQIVIGNTVLGNYNIPFTAPPTVASRTRYWIVATCGSLLANHYEWHHSAADVYPDGQAKINLNLGGGWVNPATPTDMYFVNFGQQVEANLTAVVLPGDQDAKPGDLVTFAVWLNNTGGSVASVAWLNDTLLPGLVYVSDTAGSAGSSTNWPSFTFLNVGNGPRSFTITAEVAIGTEPGTVLAKGVTLSYVNGVGAIVAAPGSQGNVFVGMQTKQLYLNPTRVGAAEGLSPARPTGDAGSQYNESVKRDGVAHDFDLAPVLARPFRVFGITATLYLDSASHDVKNLDMNLTFSDWNGVTLVPLAYVQRRVTTNAFADYQPFAFAFPPIDHTFPAGGRIRVTVRNMPTSGSDAILAMNSTFASSGLDLETTTYVRVDLLDLRDAGGSTTVWSPKDTLVVQANLSDPLGSSEISGARINLTSPAGTLVVNWTAMALIGTDPATPSAWKLYQFTYGPTLSEGTYSVDVTAIESNGVLDIAEGRALVRMPHFSFLKTATMSNVGSGDRFTYDIWFNNSGPGTAGRVWINDSLPTVLTFTSSSDPGAMTGNYNWTWTALTTGNYRLRINVQVKGGLPPIAYARNYAFLNYTDEKGYWWPMQIAFADVAFHGPVISLSKTSSKVAIHANETIAYTITMRNTGDAAQTLWVNDTLPADLAYVSDTASAPPLYGTRIVSGNRIYFRFANMPALATWAFSLTVVSGPALLRGMSLENDASLNYTNSNGFLLPPRDASWSVIIRAPWIPSASVTFASAQATPTDVVLATVAMDNDGNEAAQDAWVNLTLDPNLSFVNASIPATSQPGEVRFVLTNVGLGGSAFHLNVSINPSVVDHQTLAINGTMTYTDGLGNLFPLVTLTPDSVEVAAPRIDLSVSPDISWVEADTIAFFNVYQVNAGSGVAGDVRLTLPLPASFIFVNDSSDGNRTFLGSTYTWHWKNVAPGSNSFSLQVRARASVPNNGFASLDFHVDYTDGNGNLRTGSTASAGVRFRAPQIVFALTTTPLQARPGDVIRYNLTFHNSGNATIRNLWLTDAFDPRFDYISFSGRVPVSGQNPLNWSYTDMAPGQFENLTLVLRVKPGTYAGTLIPNAFEVVFTNSAGNVIGYARSDSAPLLILGDAVPLSYIGLAGLAVGALALLVVWRLLQVQIEEVFLVYRDGVLIYHLSRSLAQDKDEDVLGGMLTAVQEFVRDAFKYGEHRELHQLDFGDYRILIERGRNLYLAVVYSGKGTASVRRKVRRVLDHIEAAYGKVLEKWDGDMDRVVGARDVIREYLLKASGRHGKGITRLF